MSGADRVEEARFRQWLRSLDVQPSDVPGGDAWNFAVAAESWDYVTSALPAADSSATDDADGW